MPLDKGTAALLEVVLSPFLSYLFLLPPPTSVPFSLSDNKPLLLISDEPSLSLLSHAEEPLWCGHLLPEGVSKPPARTLQPNPGKPWKLACFHGLVSMHQFWRGGENERLQNLVLGGFETSLHCLAFYLQWWLSWSPFLCIMAPKF